MFVHYFDLALRSLRRNKVLTALMVLAIAVGIGASMTMLTVMHVLSGDPLPGRSGQLYHPQVNPTLPPRFQSGPISAMDYRSATDLWGAHRAERQALIANGSVRVNLPESGQPPLARQLLLTTSEFFPMFDVPFRYGGGWSASDETSHARVAVISAELNQRLFGGADSVGRSLRLNGSEVRIAGVLEHWRPAPRFYDVWSGRYLKGRTSSLYQAAEDVYLPIFTGLDMFAPMELPVHFCWADGTKITSMQSAPCSWISLWVQLSGTEAVRDYQRFLDGYVQQQKQAGRYQGEQTWLPDLMQWVEWNHVVPGNVRMQAWMAVAFLLICLINTMCLLLSKFLRRSGEIGVRRAMGASRRTVFAQCLVEAGVIGLAGGIVGWLLTLLGLWLVRRQPEAYADLAHLDLPMLVGTFVLAVVASLLAGVLPALRASRVPIGLQIKTL